MMCHSPQDAFPESVDESLSISGSQVSVSVSLLARQVMQEVVVTLKAYADVSHRAR